jgi:hypothetical protein
VYSVVAMRRLWLLLILGFIFSTPVHAEGWPEPDVTVDTGIEIRSQLCSNWCWAASIEMLSEKYGISTTQCEVVSARFTNSVCCEATACLTFCNQGANGPLTMSEALLAYHIHGVYTPTYLVASTLRSILDGGSPVLAATVPHAFIISGYKRVAGVYSYHILDPFPTTGDHWVSYSELRQYGGFAWAFTWYNLE